MPSVSVVIPVGPGHQDLAKQAAHSVASASVPEDFTVETIIVPDEHGELGRCGARNLGVSESSGEWIFFIDADDLMQGNALYLLARELKTNPAIEGCWGALRRMVSIWSHFRMALTGERLMEPDTMKTRETRREALMGLTSWLNVGHFIHRKLHERVGGWCERMDLVEDYEYLWACVVHAEQLVKIPEPLVTVRANLRSAVGPRGYTLSVYTDATVTTADIRGKTIRAYWDARGWKKWTKKERANRPAIYGEPWPHFGGEPK